MSPARTSNLFLMVSLAVAAYMVMWMPGFYLTKAVVFFGQGHFLLAYLYQWKAKKIGLRYLVSYGVMVTALFVLYAFVPHPSQWLPIVAGVLFSVHLLGDELYIAGIERTRLVTTYLASFIALYALVLVSSAYLIAVSVWVIALCLLPVLYVAYRRTREQSWSFLEMLMLLGVAHFVYALVTQARPAEVFVIFAFTIIAHYVRWYLFYWSKLSDKHEARSVYVRDVVLVHVILGVLFVAYLIEGYTGSMSIFFDPTLFYVWTILHIVFSAAWFHATPSRV